MDKETSSRVSSIAGDYLNFSRADFDRIRSDYDAEEKLINDIRSIAGSALSQDETPGQEVYRSSDIRNFQILISSAAEYISFGFQWGRHAYNASLPHEAGASDVVRALAQLGVMITRHELENEK